MEQILLIMMLTSPVERPTDKDLVERHKSSPSPAPIERHDFIRICGKHEVSSECRHLTQAEITSGTVRGIKLDIDNRQP